MIDLRDKPFLDHEDVVGLNFVKPSGKYFFRRHFRQGLRSHVMEMLRLDDLRKESKGVVIDGVRWFPKATPVRIFRLFRTRLDSLDSALQEIERVKFVEDFLAPEGLAKSTEFVVDYDGPDGCDILLCGLQEYVPGEIIDPWTLLNRETMVAQLYATLRPLSTVSEADRRQWIDRTREKAAWFIGRIKRMIKETGHVPDLAGVGNIIMTQTGDIKLVDINNIAKVSFEAAVHLDDKGYPVCDKSIEALAMLEEKLLGKVVDSAEPIYRFFLSTERMEMTRALTSQFHTVVETHVHKKY